MKRSASPRKPAGAAWRFPVLFFAILLPLFLAEVSLVAQQHVVIPMTEQIARLCGALVRLADATVVAQGKTLLHGAGGQGVSIEPGCNGLEACLILLAAVLAFPARWADKLVGLAIGLVMVQAVNLLRIISLFYLVQFNRDLFDVMHLYVWQGLIMLDVVVVWLLWVRWAAPRRAAAAAAVAAG